MTSTLREMAWQDAAACRGLPTALFFPLPGATAEAAQRVCSRCPVRVACADYGRGQSHGIWGGVVRDPANVAKDDAQAWWREAVKPPVPEGLQPVEGSPYRSQGTAASTTTQAEGAPAMTAKTTAAQTPDATAAATDETRTKSTVGKDGTHKCPSCKETMPVTKFPTARTAEGDYARELAECRGCRDARRAARRAAKDKPAAA